MSKGLNNLEAKISLVQKQTHSYLQEIRGLIEQLPNLKNPNVISYFTSNLNISHNTEYESLCLGSYHIYNIGNEPLINPYICIKLPEASPFSFSGRYVHEQFQQSLKGPNEWLRFTNDADANKKEYWLKPLGKTKIEPNEIVSFSNFQIRWFSNKFDGGSITGFTYCDQFQDGISVVNPINLSIIKLEQEELL
ncbi:hypothetical protein ACTHOQ_10605 [Solibacillus silvestris]|uniref:hypothetical protein n=1 Tax=Solibacillus silvestris TaxID=76853 RepID=UPI003F7F0691